MGKAIVIMGACIIVLLLIISIILPQLYSAKNTINKGTQLAKSVKSFFVANGIRCTARTSELTEIKGCLDVVARKNDFKLSSFKMFDVRKNITGAFIIKNDGKRTYNGEYFILLRNGVKVAKGCHITTDILPDYTCRFDLNETCIRGDVFEISYAKPDTEPIRLVTKTC